MSMAHTPHLGQLAEYSHLKLRDWSLPFEISTVTWPQVDARSLCLRRLVLLLFKSRDGLGYTVGMPGSNNKTTSTLLQKRLR